MTLDRTLLDPRQLSPAVQRALGAGPGRMMAARGLMPLAPVDQLCVLYQLALDGDAALAQAAQATAGNLPDKLLAGTLSDQALDPRVLDFFGLLAIGKAAVFDVVALNPATADQTIAGLAEKTDSRGVDLIANNEQRLLRHPEIIAAMYMNRKARMSTIDRVVELAVRNHVRVPGLAAWDEIARALTGEPHPPADDALFESVVASGDDSVLTAGDADQALPEGDEAVVEAALSSRMLELVVTRPQLPPARVALKRTRVTIGSGEAAEGRIPGAPPRWLVVELGDADITVTVVATGEKLSYKQKEAKIIDGAKVVVQPIPFRDMPIPSKIRAVTLGDAFVRAEGIRDPVRMVSSAAIKSPGVTDIEAARYAGNQALSDDVIRFIASKREWTKMYGVKVSLCRNPKTPISETTRMLPFLRDRDLQNIIRSKGVPSAVVAQARKLFTTRGGKK